MIGKIDKKRKKENVYLILFTFNTVAVLNIACI